MGYSTGGGGGEGGGMVEVMEEREFRVGKVK